MKHLQKLIATLVIVLFFFQGNASHFMGGELTWECIPSSQTGGGSFRFHVKLYRECYTNTGSPAANMPSSISITTNAPIPNFTLHLSPNSPIDLSPKCNPTLPNQISCSGGLGTNNQGMVEEYHFTSDSLFPNGITINGVPPVSGWYFYWSSCCRNVSSNITQNTTNGIAIKSVMYPYHNQNIYPCFDNSPTFAAPPVSVFEAGIINNYNPKLQDKELDSLNVSWDRPIEYSNITGSIQDITGYAPGYSYDIPLPDTSENTINQTPLMNASTGIFSFKSYTTGAFVTAQKVSAYKCGVLVAEITRDFQTIITGSSSSNNLPIVLIDSVQMIPLISIDTFYASKLIEFDIQGIDNDLFPNGIPNNVSMEVSGMQFGSYMPADSSHSNPYFSEYLGCLNPPCATLSPAPESGNPLTGASVIGSHFSWQTDCPHLGTPAGCGSTTNAYDFYFTFRDDYCPMPGSITKQLRIVLIQRPPITPPLLKCVQVDTLGKTKIFFDPIIDSLLHFDSYNLFVSNTKSGPYTHIFKETNPNMNFIMDTISNGNNNLLYYYINLAASCYGIDSTFTDTLSNLYLQDLDSTQFSLDLHWNQTHTDAFSTDSIYKIEYQKQGTSGFHVLDSTSQISYQQLSSGCLTNYRYRILQKCTDIKDSLSSTTTLYSISNQTPYKAYNGPYPLAPTLKSYVIDTANNEIKIHFTTSSIGTPAQIYVYKHLQNAWEKYDSLSNTSSTSYTDTLLNGAKISHYRMKMMDSCGTLSPFSNQFSGVGIDELEENQTDCKVYPNPSKGIFYIELENRKRVEVYDLNGALKYKSENKECFIDISHLGTGVYYLKIVSNTKEYHWKIVIE